MSDTAVVWFRRDLRVGDQPTFLAAAQAVPRALGLFVLDPALLGPSARRAGRLYRSLRTLDAALGGSLLVVRGDPADIVARIAAAVAADSGWASPRLPHGRARPTLRHHPRGEVGNGEADEAPTPAVGVGGPAGRGRVVRALPPFGCGQGG